MRIRLIREIPWVVGGTALTMTLLGLAASAIPALRALAVEPSKLMREDSA